jgi:hypothetical protein
VLVPLPNAPAGDMREFLLAGLDDAAPLPPPAPTPRPQPATLVLEELARMPLEPVAEDLPEPVDPEPIMVAALRAIVGDEEATGKATAVLFQDFQVRLPHARAAPRAARSRRLYPPLGRCTRRHLRGARRRLGTGA